MITYIPTAYGTTNPVPFVDFPAWVKRPSKCKTHTHRVVMPGGDVILGGKYILRSHGTLIHNETFYGRHVKGSDCAQGLNLPMMIRIVR